MSNKETSASKAIKQFLGEFFGFIILAALCFGHVETSFGAGVAIVGLTIVFALAFLNPYRYMK